MIENSSIWVVSDVDGTLMDHSYDLSPAKETIKKLQKLSIPIILCTSKTASEVKVIRKELNLTDPYIVENGAAIYGESLKRVNGEIILGIKYESVEEILNLNILQASLLSMKRAIGKLAVKPSLTLIDGNFAPAGLRNYKTIINGDIKMKEYEILGDPSGKPILFD